VRFLSDMPPTKKEGPNNPGVIGKGPSQKFRGVESRLKESFFSSRNRRTARPAALYRTQFTSNGEEGSQKTGNKKSREKEAKCVRRKRVEKDKLITGGDTRG